MPRSSAAVSSRRLAAALVIWVTQARQFRAYPLFRAPRGTVLTAAAPDELAAQMDRIQPTARSPQAKSPGMDAITLRSCPPQ